MIGLGSGGAIIGEQFITDRLPYAKGLQFIALYHERRGVHLEPIGVGTSIAAATV